MCVAPVVKMSDLLVAYAGVVTSAMGPSAHGLEEPQAGLVVIEKGLRRLMSKDTLATMSPSTNCRIIESNLLDEIPDKKKVFYT